MNERNIFVAALNRQNASERSAFLDETCGNNADLREQVEALLCEHERLGSFLEAPAPGATAPGLGEGQPREMFSAIDQRIAERPGTVIGPYKLLQRIGEGGFGV